MSLPAPKIDAPLAFVGLSVAASLLSNFVFGRGIGDVSCLYNAKFVPSDGAFGIWIPIYIFAVLTFAEQLHLQSTSGETYEAPLSNVFYALAWVFAALWTPAFTLKTKEDGVSEVPSATGLSAAAVFLCLSALSSLVAVLTSTAWEQTSRSNPRWIGGVAFGLLCGWVFVASSLSVAIAYNANYKTVVVPCNAYEETYTIFSPIDPQYSTYFPLALSFMLGVVAIARPNPVILLPLVWALLWMRPSCWNYAACAFLVLFETIALFRVFA